MANLSSHLGTGTTGDSPERCEAVNHAFLHNETLLKEYLPYARRIGNNWQCGNAKGAAPTAGRPGRFNIDAETATWNDFNDIGGHGFVQLELYRAGRYPAEKFDWAVLEELERRAGLTPNAGGWRPGASTTAKREVPAPKAEAPAPAIIREGETEAQAVKRILAEIYQAERDKAKPKPSHEAVEFALERYARECQARLKTSPESKTAQYLASIGLDLETLARLHIDHGAAFGMTEDDRLAIFLGHSGVQFLDPRPYLAGQGEKDPYRHLVHGYWGLWNEAALYNQAGAPVIVAEAPKKAAAAMALAPSSFAVGLPAAGGVGTIIQAFQRRPFTAPLVVSLDNDAPEPDGQAGAGPKAEALALKKLAEAGIKCCAAPRNLAGPILAGQDKADIDDRLARLVRVRRQAEERAKYAPKAEAEALTAQAKAEADAMAEAIAQDFRDAEAAARAIPEPAPAITATAKAEAPAPSSPAPALDDPRQWPEAYDINSIMETPDEPTDFIFGLLEPGDFGTLTGEGDVGKSSLCLLTAFLMAQGRSVEGFMPIDRPRRVLYVTAEDKRKNIKARRAALVQTFGAIDDDLAANFKLRIMKDIPGAGRKLCKLVPGNVIEPTDSFFALENDIKRYGSELVFIDNYATMLSVKENDNDLAAATVNLMNRLAETYHCAIVALAHTGAGKAPDKATATNLPGLFANTKYLTRGATAIVDNGRCNVCLISVPWETAQRWVQAPDGYTPEKVTFAAIPKANADVATRPYYAFTWDSNGAFVPLKVKNSAMLTGEDVAEVDALIRQRERAYDDGSAYAYTLKSKALADLFDDPKLIYRNTPARYKKLLERLFNDCGVIDVEGADKRQRALVHKDWFQRVTGGDPRNTLEKLARGRAAELAPGLNVLAKRANLAEELQEAMAVMTERIEAAERAADVAEDMENQGRPAMEVMAAADNASKRLKDLDNTITRMGETTAKAQRNLDNAAARNLPPEQAEAIASTIDAARALSGVAQDARMKGLTAIGNIRQRVADGVAPPRPAITATVTAITTEPAPGAGDGAQEPQGEQATAKVEASEAPKEEQAPAPAAPGHADNLEKREEA